MNQELTRLWEPANPNNEQDDGRHSSCYSVGLVAGTDPNDSSNGDTPVKILVGRETRTFLFFCPLPITYFIRLIYNPLTPSTSPTQL